MACLVDEAEEGSQRLGLREEVSQRVHGGADLVVEARPGISVRWAIEEVVRDRF